MLIKAGANPCAMSYLDKVHRSSALHLAVANGYESMFRVRIGDTEELDRTAGWSPALG